MRIHTTLRLMCEKESDMKLKAIAVVVLGGTCFTPFSMAEQTIGIQAPGTAASATAKLNVKVVVPNIVVLKVGSTGATVDNVQFDVGATGFSDGNSQTYSGAIPPSLNVTPSNTNVAVGAWTNAASGANLVCALGTHPSVTTALPSSGADITVTSGGSGNVTHPGGNSATLASCDGSTTSSIASLTTLGGNFNFGTATAVTGYTAGTYGNQVTYTATTL